MRREQFHAVYWRSARHEAEEACIHVPHRPSHHADEGRPGPSRPQRRAGERAAELEAPHLRRRGDRAQDGEDGLPDFDDAPAAFLRLRVVDYVDFQRAQGHDVGEIEAGRAYDVGWKT
ncbi:hypothetical protein PsYK624_081300 [Phanerochaete sordida]|uniref:Uncharacterized protein n=1 Tax=Phanerochaete sordida TaxID=48140 RepID=A0A9P3LEX2_9APHY|nr:hypothetical protein PsYK624_081300 [Phanerochaete sordida]